MILSFSGKKYFFKKTGGRLLGKAKDGHILYLDKIIYVLRKLIIVFKPLEIVVQIETKLCWKSEAMEV